MKPNRRRCSSIALVISVFIPLWLCEVHADDEAHKTLARAERFAWLQNWDKARSLYEAAEKQFMAAGDPKKAALSRIGLILSRIYTTDSLELLALLEQELKNPVVYQDPNLKLRCLASKGYLAEQHDLFVARESWTQVLELARQLGNKDWETPASGHLGIFSWVIDIDSVAATRQVGQALVGVLAPTIFSPGVVPQRHRKRPLSHAAI